MKYVILGAGAMGCLYGAMLKSIGEEVVFLANSPGNIEALNKGLMVRGFSEEGDRRFQIPAFRAEDFHEKADAVIVFTKAADSEKALASLDGVIGADTYIISLQNGIGNDAVLRKFADEERIIVGVSNIPSDRVKYGEIRRVGEGFSRMYVLSGETNEGFEAIVSAFDRAGLHPVADPEIMSAIWEKAAFNAAINSVAAAALIPQGHLLELGEGLELLHSIADEVCMVATAKGLKVSPDRVKGIIDKLLKEHANHCPSMLQDVLNARKTEIDFINGAAVREAKALGLTIPVTEVLYKLIKIAESTYEYRLLKN